MKRANEKIVTMKDYIGVDAFQRRVQEYRDEKVKKWKIYEENFLEKKN